MMINSANVLDALVSHAMTLAQFKSVETVEARNGPGQGISLAIFFEELTPVGSESGLKSASVRMQFNARLYSPLVRGNPDQIDPDLVAATDALMAAYCADFTLGGLVRQVDIYGSTGQSLQARSGYLPLDETEYRIVDITVPLIINDAWDLGE